MRLFLQVLVIGILTWGGWRCAARLLPAASWHERAVGAVVLTCSTAVVLVSGLGLASLLRPAPLAISGTTVALVGLWWSGYTATSRGGQPNDTSMPSPVVVALALAMTLAIPYAVRALWLAPVDWDGLTYHLYKPSIWLAESAVRLIDGPYPLNYVGFYPANGEALITFVSGIAGSDVLAETVNLPLMGALAITSVALAVRLGAEEAYAKGATLLWITTPALFGYAASSYVEPLMVLGLFASLLFVLRSVRRAGYVDTALAGLAIGLAVGTKYIALFGGLVLAMAVLVVPPLTARGLRTGIGRALVFVGCGLAIGGTWYVLNGLETGNPFYPVPVGPFTGMIDPRFPMDGETILSELGALIESGTLAAAWLGPRAGRGPLPPGIGLKLFLLAPVAFGGLVAAAYRVFQARSSHRRVALEQLTFVLFLLVTLLSYFQLPFWDSGSLTSHVRFLVPPLGLGAIAFGAWADRRGLSASTVAWMAIIAIGLDAVMLDLRLPGMSEAAGLILLASIFVAGSLSIPHLGRIRLRVAGMAAFVILVPIGWLADARREDARFTDYASEVELHRSQHVPFVPGAAAVDSLEGVETVAVTGPALEFMYLYTGNLDHRVIWVPHGPKSRAPRWEPGGLPDHEAWWSRLIEERVDVLVVTRWGSESWPIETSWADQLEFQRIFVDDNSEVRRVSSPTLPSK